MNILSRAVQSVAVLFAACMVSILWNTPATLALGNIAGKQFEANDQSYLVSQGAFTVSHGVNLLIVLATAVRPGDHLAEADQGLDQLPAARRAGDHVRSARRQRVL
jgi:hypothetical protein